MVKTRSQTGELGIQKEEEEEDGQPTLFLHSGSNTRTHNKVAKRKPSKDKDRRLRTQQVKVEEDTDIKPLLQSTPKSLKLTNRQRTISQEQINQLIDYVVNYGMSVSEASRIVKMSSRTGCTYYNLYKNDPEKKIPVAQNGLMYPRKFYTQEQVKNLIKYITVDKMTTERASLKANMSWASGYNHYRQYLKDNNMEPRTTASGKRFTQDEIDEFIRYIVDDKMDVKAASKKANMSDTTGRKHYRKYLNNQKL